MSQEQQPGQAKFEWYVVACLLGGDWQRAVELIDELGPCPEYAPYLAIAAAKLTAEELPEAAHQVAARGRGETPDRGTGKRQLRIDNSPSPSPHPPVVECAPSLSLCLITRNEAVNLPRVVGSVQGIASEVIVVDTGSTDETIAVACRLGARVERFEWIDDFAAARNRSLELASGEWVLVMDADDELTRESRPALRQWLCGPQPVDVVGLFHRVPHPRLPRDSVSVKARLFRNGRGLRFEGAVHEFLVTGEGQPARPETTLPVTVYHHGYIEQPDALALREARNLQLLHKTVESLQLRVEGHDVPSPHSQLSTLNSQLARTRFYLGLTLFGRGDWSEAIPHLRAAVERAPQSADFVPKAYACIGDALLKLKRPLEAEAALRAGLDQFPEHPELLFCLGLTLDYLGRLDEAITAHERALRGRFGASPNWHDYSCRESKPHLALCDLRLALGDPEAAGRHLEAAERFTGPLAEYIGIRKAIRETAAELRLHAEERLRTLNELEAQHSGGDPVAGLDLVTLLVEGSETEHATRLVDRWLAADGSCPEALLARGKCLAASGAAEEAIGYFATARGRLGEASRRGDGVTAGRGEKSKAPAPGALVSAGSPRPPVPPSPRLPSSLRLAEAWRGEATAWRALGRSAEAEQALLQAAALDTGDGQSELALGEFYLREERWDEATQCLQRSLERRSDVGSAWLGLGKALLRSDHVPTAVQCYKQAASLSGSTAAVRIALGEARACLAARG